MALSCQGWKYPLTLSGEYILNTRADIDEDQGWAAGASLGSAKKRGDWRIYYQWQSVGQDAVLSAFAQDDLLFATSYRSHLFGINHQILDGTGLHLWGSISERDKPSAGQTDDGQWRLRLDLNIKF